MLDEFIETSNDLSMIKVDSETIKINCDGCSVRLYIKRTYKGVYYICKSSDNISGEEHMKIGKSLSGEFYDKLLSIINKVKNKKLLLSSY